MNIFQLAGIAGAIALVAACSTQNSAPATNAAALPAASGETVVSSKNIVPTGPSTAAAKPDAAKKPGTAKFSGSDVVCKRKVITGSRFAKRVCLTRGEWKSIQDLGQKTADDFQKRGLRTNQPVGN